MVAKALVRAGHVADLRQAFDQLIGEGKPAFIPRCGPSPVDVIGIINQAGGIASLAHPGLLKRDELIPSMIDSGLTALEAFHSEHDVLTTQHYLALADHHGILVSGGSDYHGDKERRKAAFGTIGLPHERFEMLKASVTRDN
jgi:predicted metal-dependent phosphoesterase TrpH